MKKISLITPILWLLTTIAWGINFGIDINNYGFSSEQVLLKGGMLLVSLVATIIYFIVYKKAKNEE